ncbi:MAG: ATP-binding protein [Bacteroidales bacterium]
MEHVLGISVAVSDIDWVKTENEGITFHPYALIGLIAVLVLIHLGCFLYIKSLKSEKAGFKSQLARKTRDMERQKEELQTQIEFTTIQNHKIEKQNQELRKHRQNLESLVKKRTKDLEEAKRKAEESDRLKSAFLANMSHEIRTPMNAIVGFSNILFEDNLSGKEQYELLRLINDNTNHLLKLIENLIDISKIEADELKFKYNPIDLNNLLEEIYFEYLDLNDLKNKGISLTVDKQEEEEDVYIYTDSWRLHQIISNLIDNAVKFTQSGKIVFGYRIRKTQSGKTLEFYVQDTGIGMSKEQQKHIYEIFRKMDHNHTGYSSGTGIGLSICKKLVEGLEGNIWVDSDAGKGSTFYFTLPYYEVKNFSF